MAEIVDFGLQQHKIKMDSRYFENVLSVVAGDTGRRIEVQLLDTNGTVQNTTGLNLRLNAVIAGKATFTDATLVDAATGKYQLDLSNGMFLAPGNWQFQWLITDSAGKKLHSFAFAGNVGKNISEGGSQATNFYLNLEDLKAMQDDLVNGTIDSSILETNITEKLEALEETYAPRLTEVTAQLAQTVKRGEVGINDIDKNKGLFDETYFSESLKAQMIENTQGFTVVPADRSITRIKIADKAVSSTQTDFFSLGKNLFNKDTVSHGKRVSNTNGILFDVEGVSTSEFINVQPSTTYFRSHTESYAIYDSNNVFITGRASNSDNNIIDIPSNGAKIRLSMKTEYVNSFQLERGNVGTSYEMYNGILSPKTRIKKESLPPISLTDTDFHYYSSDTKNLFNPYDYTSGLLDAEGNVTAPHDFYNTTGYIYIRGLGQLSVSGNVEGTTPVRRACAFYDLNHDFISGFPSEGFSYNNPLYVPTNAIYARFSYVNVATEIQIENNSYPTEYEPFVGVTKILPTALPYPNSTESNTDFFKGKKLVVNGDSITFGTGGTIPFEGGNYDNQIPWANFVADSLGMGLSNYGIGGATIAVKESAPTDRDPIVTRYQNMSEGEVIIIAGGSNDWTYDWTPLGDMTSRTNFTFYGALHNLCLGLLDKYKGKQIVFTTPIKRGQSRTQESVNANGKTLNEYGGIIKEVCGYYGIPVIDMYNEVTINPNIDSQRSAFIPDTVHPNRAGHELMARRITGYLRQLA